MSQQIGSVRIKLLAQVADNQPREVGHADVPISIRPADRQPVITAWLVRHRDTAAASWLDTLRACTTTHATREERAARHRLARWDLALSIWTNNGRR